MNVVTKVGENVVTFFLLFTLCTHDLESAHTYKFQNKKIQKLMKRAYEIPFYRKKFEEAGVKPEDFKCREDLIHFPVTTKSELREWLADEVVGKESKFHIFSTSGSTGMPLKVPVSPRENAYLTANWLRMAVKWGINPFTSKTLALKNPKLVSGNDSILQKLGILRRKKVSFLVDGHELMKTLNQYKPDFFYAHKSKLEQMIEAAQEKNCPLYQPKVCVSVSEMITEKDEQILCDNLNHVASSYGCIEAGACTYTPVGNLHKHIVTNDTHVINVVDEEGNLADEGWMYLTNLNFYHFPIINYDIGDKAETFEEQGVQYIRRIQGRMNDVVYLRDGRKYGWQTFALVFRKYESILHTRVIQKDYEILQFQMVTKKECSVEDKKEMEQLLTDDIDREMNVTGVRYEFTWQERLQADDTGKVRMVTSYVTPNTGK